jgi:hypothetical protein
MMFNFSSMVPDLSSVYQNADRGVENTPRVIPPKRKYSQRFLNRLKIRFGSGPGAQSSHDSPIAGLGGNDRRRGNDTSEEIAVIE